MKKILIYSLLALIGAVFLAGLIKNDAGYVVISYGQKTIEMTLWFSILAVVFLVFCVWLTFKLLTKVYGSLASSVSWISESKAKKASRRTQEGLVYFIEGNWRDAKRYLLSAARNTESPLVHYLASARSAYELGDTKETQRLLLEAEKIAPKNSLAILLSQARIQLADNKYEQCLATLQRARTTAAHHPVVLDLLRQVYWQLGDWQPLIELLPAVRNTKPAGDKTFERFELGVFSAYLSSVFSEKSVSETSIRSAWQRVPKQLKLHPELLSHYCQLLLLNARDNAAEQILRSVLNKTWAPELVVLYGKASATPPKEQLVVAEKWLREHPGDADLLAALGRICLRNELWGKARNYFESSLKLREAPDLYAELAALFAQLGEHQKSTQLYQKGLLLSTSHAVN